jgi:hypothetical protein
LHLCCASLFWLIVVFTPLSCLLLPHSPKRAFVTVRPVANPSCPPPHSSCPPSHPFVVPAGCCITHCLCYWHLHCCCAHANALVALASLPCCAGIFAIVAANTAVVYYRFQTNLCCASLFWLNVVFTAHCCGGAADDKKWCGTAEDDGAYHRSSTAKDNAVYPGGCEEMIRSGVAWQKTMVPTTKVPWRKTTPCIPMVVRLKKTLPPPPPRPGPRPPLHLPSPPRQP